MLRADSVGPALQVVLESLTPAERLAFVLHDMFGLPFEQIAPIVDRTPVTAKKLASRADFGALLAILDLATSVWIASIRPLEGDRPCQHG